MMSEQTISDIIRGMQHAVNTAEDMLTAHQIEKLTEAFNEDGTPKMRFITLPDGRKGKRIFGKDEGVIRIRMKFHEKEEPEAVARAREILDSIVR